MKTLQGAFTDLSAKISIEERINHGRAWRKDVFSRYTGRYKKDIVEEASYDAFLFFAQYM